MVKFSVGVYARLRPSRPRQTCHIRTTEDRSVEPPVLRSLDFSIQRKNEGEYINNKVDQYRFTYDRVFDGSASQVRGCPRRWSVSTTARAPPVRHVPTFS